MIMITLVTGSVLSGHYYVRKVPTGLNTTLINTQHQSPITMQVVVSTLHIQDTALSTLKMLTAHMPHHGPDQGPEPFTNYFQDFKFQT